MDLIDRLRVLSAQVEKQQDYLKTEEATKHALILPFIHALGYDVFNPSEVVPELTADVGMKKGEKVDYAIYKEGQPIILFECKCFGCDLELEHASQLFRYFVVTKAKFGVLTNGITYKFYTDIEETNKMDPKPFFEFNLLDIRDQNIDVLKRFTKQGFNQEQNFSAAIELKYTKEIKRLMAEEVNSPSEGFTRLFTSRVYSGRMTQQVLAQFSEITKRALGQFINDRLNERLKSAMEQGEHNSPEKQEEAQQTNGATSTEQEKRIVTTEEEMEGYYLVKAILRDIVDPKRIAIRDTQSYCGILLDDNKRKPICRLYFNTQKKYIGTYDENKQEERTQIEDINDIFKVADRLKGAVKNYEGLLVAQQG